jgi:HEAT repeat protein
MLRYIFAIAFALSASTLPAQVLPVQGLVEQLQSGSVAERREAAVALGRASFARSVAALTRALGNETNVGVRLELVRALRHVVFSRFPGYPEALQALGRACDAAREQDELVRLRASEALWEAAKRDLLDPVPFLSRNLADPSQRLRLSAVQMLRKLGTPATLDPLGRAAIDKSQHQTIRLKAIEALGAVSLSDHGAAGREIAAANRQAMAGLRLPEVTSPGIFEQRHRRQVAFLSIVVRDRDSADALVLRAVKSMGQVKDKSAIPALHELLQGDPSPTVRKQATGVLSHLLSSQYE